MKREIKFRAWDIINKIIIASDSVNHLVEFDGTVWENKGMHESDMLFERDNLILMQFTGIKDVKGNEIYEGDIIKSSYGSKLYQVEFKKSTWWATAIPQTYRGQKLHIINSEIIGNIYQNPELISITKDNKVK